MDRRSHKTTRTNGAPRSPNATRDCPRKPGVKSFTTPGAHLLAFFLNFFTSSWIKNASQRRAIKAIAHIINTPWRRLLIAADTGVALPAKRVVAQEGRADGNSHLLLNAASPLCHIFLPDNALHCRAEMRRAAADIRGTLKPSGSGSLTSPFILQPSYFLYGGSRIKKALNLRRYHVSTEKSAFHSFLRVLYSPSQRNSVTLFRDCVK